MSLEFSAMHLVIGEESPSADVLKPAFSNAKGNYSANDTHYLITKENLNDEYFWLYAHYGKSLPYSPTVYNTQDQKEEANPRSRDKIETDKQLFALYAVNSSTFYLSNTKNKSWMEEYLKSQLEQDVFIKCFFKKFDEFIKQIKSVEKVKFVAKRNLFSAEGEIMKIFPSPKDMYGLGMPEDFTLEANFAHARPTKKFTEYLGKMVGWKNNCEADSLLCVGRDDNNFETVFNADNFIQKVSVAAAKNDLGLYEPATVKQALIEKIGGTYE